MRKYVEAVLWHVSGYRDHYLFREYLMVELRHFRAKTSLVACLEPLIQEYPEHEDIIREAIATRLKEIRLAYG